MSVPVIYVSPDLGYVLVWATVMLSLQWIVVVGIACRMCEHRWFSWLPYVLSMPIGLTIGCVVVTRNPVDAETLGWDLMLFAGCVLALEIVLIRALVADFDARSESRSTKPKEL